MENITNKKILYTAYAFMLFFEKFTSLLLYEGKAEKINWKSQLQRPGSANKVEFKSPSRIIYYLYISEINPAVFLISILTKSFNFISHSN